MHNIIVTEACGTTFLLNFLKGIQNFCTRRGGEEVSRVVVKEFRTEEPDRTASSGLFYIDDESFCGARAQVGVASIHDDLVKGASI